MSWEPMKHLHLKEVCTLADSLYPDHYEERSVMEHRLRQFPEGCKVLSLQGKVVGYAVAHPLRDGQVVLLNDSTLNIPKATDELATVLYIHDVAVAEPLEGRGYATRVISLLEQLAIRLGFASMVLVSVNDSLDFWIKQGFELAGADADELSSYGGKAWYMKKKMTTATTPGPGTQL